MYAEWFVWFALHMYEIYRLAYMGWNDKMAIFHIVLFFLNKTIFAIDWADKNEMNIGKKWEA